MWLILFAAIASLAGPPATAQAPGETVHYIRSNRDGSEPEHIYVHRAAPDRLAVYKMVERCTRAALVTATIDPTTGQASRLDAGGLRPDGGADVYGTMIYDAAARRIDASVTMDGRTLPASITATRAPWHLYDYDLATLSVAGAAIVRERRRAFDFGLALVWVGDHPADYLRWLGDARARFVRTERHLGTNTRRYAVTGPAFGKSGGGPLWLDARDGSIVDAQWGRPNHSGYRDFRLRRVGRETPGATAWAALLRRHFEGCPPR